MNAYRWLLLDADNTLFDFDAAEEFALTRTLIRHQLPPSPEVKACYRAINSALWGACDRGEISQDALVLKRFNLFFQEMGITGEAAEWNDFYLNALADCPTLLPGAEALCRKLADRYILALITNGVTFVQRRRLKNSPLGPYFKDRIFISGEMGCRKPDKRFFDKVLTSLGATSQKGKVLVIGDSLSSDIRGAFNARLDSVWLRWPSSKPGPIRATYEVENLAQLAQLLEVDRYLPITI
ncbi:MAG: noncanonical pyrimidine nucleotidase, YjjG family [Oscillospiraceae bacterium]|nr:noncanonical pyrimidine nucleotidase, YjjG family [Oscillospiraceae bacterium]